MHEFFYVQSNYKVGASENNLKLEFKEKNKKWFNKNYFENTLNNNAQLSIEKFRLFDNLKKSKLKFNFTIKMVYSLSIIGFVLILGFLVFFISQFKNNESKITNKSFVIEKGFLIF